jgi:hypothetical protein
LELSLRSSSLLQLLGPIIAGNTACHWLHLVPHDLHAAAIGSSDNRVIKKLLKNAELIKACAAVITSNACKSFN